MEFPPLAYNKTEGDRMDEEGCGCGCGPETEEQAGEEGSEELSPEEIAEEADDKVDALISLLVKKGVISEEEFEKAYDDMFESEGPETE